MFLWIPKILIMVFYAGAKWQQVLQSRVQKVPIRGFGGSDQYLAFPSVNQSAYWLEGFAGARVQLFKSNLYVDVNAQPRFFILFYQTRRNETHDCAWIW